MTNVIKGYKIFNNNLTNIGYQYIVGLNSYKKGSIKMCETGFHFCKEALDCLRYYSLQPTNRYFEVSATDDIANNLIVISNNDKSVTNNLTLEKELSFDEFSKLCTGFIKKQITVYFYLMHQLKEGRIIYTRYYNIDNILIGVTTFNNYRKNNIVEYIHDYDCKVIYIYQLNKLIHTQYYKINGEKMSFFDVFIKKIQLTFNNNPRLRDIVCI